MLMSEAKTQTAGPEVKVEPTEQDKVVDIITDLVDGCVAVSDESEEVRSAKFVNPNHFIVGSEDKPAEMRLIIPNTPAHEHYGKWRAAVVFSVPGLESDNKCQVTLLSDGTTTFRRGEEETLSVVSPQEVTRFRENLETFRDSLALVEV